MNFALLLLLLLAVLVSADSTSPQGPGVAQSQPRMATAQRMTPVCESPLQGMLPLRYLEKGDTCTVDSVKVDSAGAGWFSIKGTAGNGWVRGEDLRLTSSWVDLLETAEESSDDDRKRRYAIVREHPDWPRRIQKIVRDGKICLGLTTEQLRASWGKPYQQSRCFILGIGEHDVWLYMSGTARRVSTVHLQDDRVIGWNSK